MPSRSNRFGRGPMMETRLITSSSRIGSIGGLVTCGNFCLKEGNSGFGLSDSAEIGVSLAIEPLASSPVDAIGVIRMLISSWLEPDARLLSSSSRLERMPLVGASGKFFKHDLGAVEPFAIGMVFR